MALIGYRPPYPDPEAVVAAIFGNGGTAAGGLNLSRYHTPTSDGLVAARTHLAGETRDSALAGIAARFVADDAPVVPLWASLVPVVRSSRLAFAAHPVWGVDICLLRLHS